MAAEAQKSLHIAMFPWLAFGHILPYFQLSKLLAQKGHRISFISAPRNIDRLPKLPPNLASSFNLVKIPLQRSVADLPENAEATTDIHGGLMDHLKKAFDGMQTGLALFLEESRPDWIIYDFAPHWLPSIAARLGISRAFFLIMSSWFLAFYGPTNSLISGTDYRTKPEDFMVPPKWVKFETKVAYRRFEAEWMVGSGSNNGSGYSDYYRVGNVINGSEAILVRSCYEFEADWLTVLENLYHIPVVPVGLLPSRVREFENDSKNDDDDDDEVWDSVKNWLDSRDKGSVVYVALGSEVTPNQDQLSELAYGIELSGVPFFWVLRKPSESSESNSAELPAGFERRVRGRGIVWKSWAPQLKILSHDSVGGFLTHCGWSSTVEGLALGRPLITLPFFVDQGLNSRVIAEKQLGIEIPRNEEDGSYTRDSVADSVKAIMHGNEGKKFREKAEEMGAIFGDVELHDRYIEKTNEFLKNHKIV